MLTDVDPPPLREPVVLCVDDDAQILAALRRLFRGEPYDVVTAHSAAQALAALRARPVEVVISDERMPETTGCELLAEIRQRWPWIGRVILTGHPGHSVMIRGFRVGVDILFQKPWDDALLKRTIRRLIFGDGPETKLDPGGKAAEPPEGRHLVVLVDDEPEVLAALKRSLTRESYLVLTTSRPKEALRWVEALDVSAVVSDERMPDMSGTDLLARISDRSPSTARIMLTAFGGLAVKQPGLRNSTQCMIAKPWDDSMLRLALRECILEREGAEADDPRVD
jgi:DNA-binding NtrC family response regulator